MSEMEEESLGSGRERQLTQVQRVKEVFEDLQQDLEVLRSRCGQLKKERTDLISDCQRRMAERGELQVQIDNLTSERDCLRVEIASEREIDRLWTQYDAESSGGNSGRVFDDKGRMKRRIWVLEHSLKDKEDVLATEQRAKEDAVMAERAVSTGLREHIAQLEEKNRGLKAEIQEGLIRENQQKTELLMMKGTFASQGKGMTDQLEDLKGSLARERKEKSKLDEDLTSLREWKIQAEGELRALRELKAKPVSPSRILQPQSLNIARANTPSTPSMSASAYPTSFQSPQLFSPTTNLAKRYAYLEDRHHLLKEEYDKLRVKYTEDLRHWKEYKAVETARIDLKRQKKAEKREAREKRKEGTLDTDDTRKAHELVAASDASQSLSQHRPDTLHGKHAGLEEDPNLSISDGDYQRPADIHYLFGSKDEVDRSSNTAGRSDPDRPYELDYELGYGLNHPQEEQEENTERERVVLDKMPFEKRGSPRVSSAHTSYPISGRELRSHTPLTSSATAQARVTPSGNSRTAQSTRRAVTTAARVTPWLGGPSPQKTTQASVKKPKRKSTDMNDEDVFGPEDDSSAKASGSTKRTPLVRDRGVEATSSLRRSTLRKTIASADVSTPAREGDKRRKIDLETLSPAEKAAELKRVNKMSAAEKREYYAGYKGKGRYLPPEEVSKRVYDEFEIDPKQNEGVAHQFHDVKRGRDQRRQMHGGDCECCKDYYEAIGPLPQYNQAPKWKDQSQSEMDQATREAEMQEHQNKVSRHRETWRRPPTPPGFWQIGFPTTQDVKKQNAEADEMTKKREEQVRREAAHRDSKWRKKA